MRILSGRFKGRALPVPVGARPAGSRLRTSLFSVLGASLEGARVLDVFAGAGGLSLEALSRGAQHVTLLDVDRRAVAGLNAWLETVGAAGEGQALPWDALRRPWPAGPFDLVFLDPPFELWEGAEGASLVRQAAAVLAPGGRVVVKCPRRLELALAEGLRQLTRRDAGEAAFVLLSGPA